MNIKNYLNDQYVSDKVGANTKDSLIAIFTLFILEYPAKVNQLRFLTLQNALVSQTWLPLKCDFGGCRYRFGTISRLNRFSTLGVFLKGFSVLITLLLKMLYLLLSYPLKYNQLKGEPQISRKAIFIPRYLQYKALGDCVFFQFLVFMCTMIYIYIHINTYIYIYIYINTYIHIYLYMHHCMYVYTQNMRTA